MQDFLKTIAAVLWAFLGIRKQAKHEEDTKLKLSHIIIVGILLTLVFIFALMALVKWVVNNVPSS